MVEAPLRSRSGPRDAAVRGDDRCENGAAGQPRCGTCPGCERKIRRMAGELKSLWEAGHEARKHEDIGESAGRE